jgi:minor extracellular serine protease Vpr
VVRRARSVRPRLAAPAALAVALALPVGGTPSASTAAVPVSTQATVTSSVPAEAERLYVVTFGGPGTAGYRGPLTPTDHRKRLTARQDEALAAVDAPAPVYRWTTSLNGVAVRLSEAQADGLRAQPRVALVEKNQVRPLTTVAATAAPPRASARSATGRGGRGVVVGVVDTGVWPESPVFADSPGLGRTLRDRGFSGTCRSGEEWSPGIGNAQVDVAFPGLRAIFSGVAPRARLAAYKACWSAPDPADDGCATADLVAAIDRATRDGVDVLNLGVGDVPGIDTVDRALLGAAEAGVVVVAAAGNGKDREFAAHDSPWITTVGGLRGTTRTGTVSLAGTTVRGAMTARRPVRARLVRGRDVPAPGFDAAAAATCRLGSLDAARVAGRIVECRRGGNGRVEKSAAVARAGGVGMVLVNTRAGSVAQDLHAVPTVHLAHRAATTLRRAATDRDRPRVTLRPDRPVTQRLRVAGWSSAGDPAGALVKPDLVAPASGVLAATAPTTGRRWALASGTSAATAWTSGAAAVLLARDGWSESAVRSALVGSARTVPGSVLRTGAGAPALDRALRARLVHEVPRGSYRAWLAGSRKDVNGPSLLARGSTTLARRVTNVGRRTGTWSVSVTGIERYDISVSPATLTLRPGESAVYRVTVGAGSLVGGLDDGAVVWTGDRSDVVRVPLAVTR